MENQGFSAKFSRFVVYEEISIFQQINRIFSRKKMFRLVHLDSTCLLKFYGPNFSALMSLVLSIDTGELEFDGINKMWVIEDNRRDREYTDRLKSRLQQA